MADFESNPILSKLYEQLARKIERNFKDNVQREGLISSADLVNSIKAGKVTVGNKTIATSVVFSALLRVKDMKTLSYSTIPPLGPLVEWVERTGLSKFAYVPGYSSSVSKASDIDKVYRIASGIQYHLKASPNVKRGYRGIYNEDLYRKIVPEFIETLRASSEMWARLNIEEALGYDVKVPVPNDTINAARVQAAWNARDTKLSRKYATVNSSK